MPVDGGRADCFDDQTGHRRAASSPLLHERLSQGEMLFCLLLTAAILALIRAETTGKPNGNAAGIASLVGQTRTGR